MGIDRAASAGGTGGGAELVFNPRVTGKVDLFWESLALNSDNYDTLPGAGSLVPAMVGKRVVKFDDEGVTCDVW